MFNKDSFLSEGTLRGGSLDNVEGWMNPLQAVCVHLASVAKEARVKRTRVIRPFLIPAAFRIRVSLPSCPPV